MKSTLMFFALVALALPAFAQQHLMTPCPQPGFYVIMPDSSTFTCEKDGHWRKSVEGQAPSSFPD